MLTRSIDLDDPSDVTIEEKIFSNAKRVCVTFAVAALAISGLDLLNIRPLERAAEFVQAHRNADIAEWPALIRTGIAQIALDSPASVTVAIPGEALAMTPPPPPPARAAFASAAAAPPATDIDIKIPDAVADEAPSVDTGPATATVANNAAVADLAAARRKDAVEVAMVAPPTLKPATLADLAQHAQDMANKARDSARAELPASASPAAATMQLASLTPNALPDGQAAAQASKISLPDMIAVLPPPAPGAPPPSPAERLHLEGKERARAERCLANAIYFEARDQPYKGQVAVAQVVMNRVFSGIYPHDVCGVIYQNANRHLACQFTFACNGKRKIIDERAAWARANRIARQTLDGVLYVQAVGTATHYHATYVRPSWVHEMHRIAREGTHLFYRPIAWGSGANEPVWSREQQDAQKQLASNSKKR